MKIAAAAQMIVNAISHTMISPLNSVLDEFFVDPIPPVVAPPDFSKNEPAGNRSPWNDDRPKVPDFRPGGLRTQARYLKTSVALRSHFPRRSSLVRAQLAPGWRSIGATCSSSWTRWRSCCSSRNRLARSAGDANGVAFRSFDRCRELEEIIFD